MIWLASTDMDSCVQPIKRHVPPTRLETSVNPGRNKLCVWNVKDGYCCCASDGQHHLSGSRTQACYVRLKSFYNHFHAENNWLIKINSIYKSQIKSFKYCNSFSYTAIQLNKETLQKKTQERPHSRNLWAIKLYSALTSWNVSVGGGSYYMLN